MEYPRLARDWRTSSADPAESKPELSVGGMSASVLRRYSEATESQEELAAHRRPDPESTEEILAARAASGKSGAVSHGSASTRTSGERTPGVRNGHAKVNDVTHPIALPLAAARSRPKDPPVSIRFGDDQEDPSELVELVVEQRPPRSSVTPGDVLAGRYVVIEEVSHCGMGLVYKARDRRREQAGLPIPWVALKFARPSDPDASGSSLSPYLREEFLKLSKLSHPNVVSVYDFDNDEGLDFIVMEWLEGETLASLLDGITSKRLALGKAEEIVRSVADALAHAHDRGVVHGDVKPSNIFVTHDRVVKLLDFGSSGHTADGDAGRTWATRAYASGEVLRGRAPQPHDDVFALGVTAYCLLSGERPFAGEDAVDAEEQRTVPEPLPPDAQEHAPAIWHALQFAAADRPSTAREFLLEFDDPPADPAPTAERTQLEHIAYGAVATALLIALVAWTVGSVGGSPDERQQALQQAAAAMAAGHLVEPVEGSALALYTSVLDASPTQAAALDGVKRIAEHYLNRAREALSASEAQAAAAHLETARQAMPEHYGIAITAELIDRHGKDLLQNARQVAAMDPGQAELLLRRAAALVPADDPMLVGVQAELEEQKLARRLDSLLRGIDQRILAERLTVPRGDSAVDLLREARSLAPGDRQVSLAADRIATALLFQSMFAISSSELEAAQRYLDAAKALNVKHLALARAQYELAKARHAAVRSRGNAGD